MKRVAAASALILVLNVVAVLLLYAFSLGPPGWLGFVLGTALYVSIRRALARARRRVR